MTLEQQLKKSAKSYGEKFPLEFFKIVYCLIDILNKFKEDFKIKSKLDVFVDSSGDFYFYVELAHKEVIYHFSGLKDLKTGKEHYTFKIDYQDENDCDLVLDQCEDGEEFCVLTIQWFDKLRKENTKL